VMELVETKAALQALALPFGEGGPPQAVGEVAVTVALRAPPPGEG